MPREYRQGTPAGDPTNPLSIVSSSVDIQQFTYTPQTAVAEPENQYAQLLKILELGGAAAKNVMDYNTQVIENNMAIKAAYDRNQAKLIGEKEEAIEQQEKIAYKREVAIRKEQDGIVQSYDAEITAALFNNDFDTAYNLATKMSTEFPVEQNPYVNSKAQDQLLRIKQASKIFANEADSNLQKTSNAIRGRVLYGVMTRIEDLESRFANPETRSEIMGMVDGQVDEKGNVIGYVPDNQLHPTMAAYLLNNIPDYQNPSLTEEDRIEISTAILRLTGGLRTNIIQERNNRATFAEIQKRYDAAIYLANSMNNPSQDLGALFGEFDALDNDVTVGRLTPSQRDKMQTNLVAVLGTSLGKESPVSGALSYADTIDQAVLDGNIPVARGQRISALLRKRATTELQNRLNGLDADAASKSTSESTYLFEAFPSINPTTEIGMALGIYSKDEDNNIVILPGREKQAEELKKFSDKWARHEAAYVKQQGVRGNIETIDGLVVANNEIAVIRSEIAARNKSRPENEPPSMMDPETSIRLANPTTVNFRGYLAYKSDPKQQEKFAAAMTQYANAAIQLHNEQAGPDKLYTLRLANGVQVQGPLGVISNEDFKNFAELAGRRDIAGLEAALADYRGQNKTNNVLNRMVWMHGVSLLGDLKLSAGTKAGLGNPRDAQMYTDEELYTIANNKSDDLYKRSDKMSVYQLDVEEQETARLVSISKTYPQSFMKYLSERYFMADGKASPEQLRKGYDLTVMARGIEVGPNGIPVAYAPIGTQTAEAQMYAMNPIMMEAIMIAEGEAVGTNKSVYDFLPAAYLTAVKNNQIRETKGPVKDLRDMIPAPRINSQTGLPMIDTGTLYGQRSELFRKTVREVYGQEIPYGEYGFGERGKDPTVGIDLEDMQRMNAMFGSFLDKGYSVDTAMKMTVRNMGQLGYRLIIPANLPGAGAEGSASAMFVFDPLNNIPDEKTMQSDEWQQYMNDVASVVLGQQVNLQPGGWTVAYQFNTDFSFSQETPLPVSLISADGRRIDIRGGVSQEDFEVWRTANAVWKQDKQKK